MKKTGQKLKTLIKNSGLSKSEICRRAKIQHTQLNNMIKGTSDYTIGTLIKVIEVFENEINFNLKT